MEVSMRTNLGADGAHSRDEFEVFSIDFETVIKLRIVASSAD
jgi:hypothetical protein